METTNAYLRDIWVTLFSILMLVLIALTYAVVKMEGLSFWFIPIIALAGFAAEITILTLAEKRI